MVLVLEEGQRLTGMNRWLKGWTSSNEVGGQEFEQLVAFLEKGKGGQARSSQAALVLQAARGEFRPPIEVSLQSKLGDVQTANTYCRGLSAPIPGVRSTSTNNLRTGIPRDDANPEHSLSLYRSQVWLGWLAG